MDTNLKKESPLINILKIAGLVYILLISISLLSAAFKCLGEDFSKALLQMTDNPFLALFIGIFATSLVQSSSSTTSIVVGMVASGVLTVTHAIPIIMGANIGTTVTNIIVSLGHITRKEEFKRAFAGALVHDFFNLMSVCILLPLELTFHVLEKSATFCAIHTFGAEGFSMINPIKPLTKPVTKLCEDLLIKTMGISQHTTGLILAIISIALLFISLYLISRLTKKLMKDRTELILDKALAQAGYIGILIGMIITAFIQSSSITTSILVPLIGSGVLSIESAFPITLGANLGTTVTALMASLTGNISAVTIAFVHLLFNLFGILIIYPFPAIRNIPIFLAKKTAHYTTESRKIAIVCVFSFFYIIPGILAWFFHVETKKR
ncbi:MAG: Na/Pi symporter [bacterium]